MRSVNPSHAAKWRADPNWEASPTAGGVVVARRVDHQRAEHLLHPRFDLTAQLVKLALPEEGRDVVVGMEAMSRVGHTLADAFGRRHLCGRAVPAKGRGHDTRSHEGFLA
jgi:hypothetical protein